MNFIKRSKLAWKILITSFVSKSGNSQSGAVSSTEFIPLSKILDYSFAEFSTENALTKGYTNPYFFTVLSDLAEISMSLPKFLANDNEEEVNNPALSSLFNNPNSFETAHDFWFRFFANGIAGDVYVISPQTELEGIQLPFAQLICPIPYNVTPHYTGFGRKIERYTVNYRGYSYSLPASQVLHIKQPNISFDDHQDRGFGALRGGGKFWEVSNNQLGTQAGAFKNIGANKLLTADGNMPMLPKEAKEVQQYLDSLILGHDKVGRSIVVSTAMKVMDIGANPKDYTFPELNDMAIQQACMPFKVPPPLYGYSKTSTYNNIESMQMDRLLKCIGWADNLCKELSTWLYESGNIGLNEGEVYQVDKTAIPQLNKPNLEYMSMSTELLEKYNAGQITREQARLHLLQFDYSEDEVNSMLSES